ncbi:anion transporter [Williamsia limnetica]|uniref:Anion transporter n=2 Tax=Williamsia limnetica TaxID=882452 RepID=A0A318S747_WILLI|nr:anion transporter [Williamsia limnetica]
MKEPSSRPHGRITPGREGLPMRTSDSSVATVSRPPSAWATDRFPAPDPCRESRPSTRRRIAAWTLLGTFVVLAIATGTARTVMLRAVDDRANNVVAQQTDQFQAFATTGVDPFTTRPFDSVERTIEVYLLNHPPGPNQVMFGVVGDRTVGMARDGAAPVVASELLLPIVTAAEAAGVTHTPAGEMRWTRVGIDDVAGGTGLFVFGVVTGPERDLVEKRMWAFAAAGMGGLVLTTSIVYLVSGRSRLPVTHRPVLPKAPPRILISAIVALAACIYVATAGLWGDLSVDGALTLVVFLVAVWLWIFAPVEDTYVALGAALALVMLGPIESEQFTRTLGDHVIWLLVGSFVVAAAVTASGLSARVAARVLSVARTPRQLVHLVTLVLLLTTFAIPATSGRAALALPVFLALATVLRHRPQLVLCLALVFPSVILFSAIGSLLGAGAHLVTSEIVRSATGSGIGFLTWMLLGLPLAVLWSHLCAEIALLLFTDHTERRSPLVVRRSDLLAAGDCGAGKETGPRAELDHDGLSPAQRRMAGLLGAVVLLWCSEPLHGIDPAIVAMLGAMVAVAPGVGATTLGAAVKTIPWNLLLFMAATLCLGVALSTSGAAQWVADQFFTPMQSLAGSAGWVFVVAVVIISLAAHLFVQSRSARSAVLIPVIVATAPAVGIDPTAAAFISTAAAGFCITLTSSAKPVAMFAATDQVPGYDSRHLLRLSAVLAPVSTGLLLVFALWIWPALGLTLHAA